MFSLIILILAIYIIYHSYKKPFLKQDRNYIGVSNNIKMYDFLYSQIKNDMDLTRINTENQLESLKRLNRNNIQFAFLQEDFIKENISDSDNIRGVVSFMHEYLIAFCQSYIDEKNFIDLLTNENQYSIGIDIDNSLTYKYFTYLENIIKNMKDKNNNIYKSLNIVKLRKKELFDEFKNGQLDCIFLITSNNDKMIKDLVKYIQVNFININVDNLDNNSLLNLYKKNYRISSFTNNFYNIDKSDSVTTLGSKIIVATNKYVNNNNVYNFIKKTYNNLIKIRDNISNIDKTKYLSFSYKNDITPFKMSYIKDIPIHDGSKKYLTEIGIFTTNNNINCYKNASIKKCDL